MKYEHRYDRNVMALSPEECEQLQHARVAVVGCGGLGGAVIEALARIGVGYLRVIDGDAFEESNLNRQILALEGNLGTPKAQAAAERIHAINSDAEVDARILYIDEANAKEVVEGVDCVVDCLDNLEGRFWTAHACQELGLPIVYGAIAGWFGQVCTVYPGDASFATIYGATQGESLHKRLGNLPFTAYVTAAIQSAEAVKVLLGRDGVVRNRLLMVDLVDGSFEEVELR